MNLDVADELVIEGIARAFERMLTGPEMEERIVERLAELRTELLTPAEAGKLVGLTAGTLLRNHVALGLTKSVALGPDNPRFYRSQIMARMRAGDIQGRAKADGKVTEFPAAALARLTSKQTTNQTNESRM